MSELRNCKICNQKTTFLLSGKILDKYNIDYFTCPNCGFTQTEEPYWLNEAYSKAITSSDIGLISRNITYSALTQRFIRTLLSPDEKFIDYGGGYGMFTRMMRDKGFDFYHSDPTCENLFASGFEANITNRFECLTAWEVFEHLVDPMNTIAEMLEISDTILFSTSLNTVPPRPVNEWWYYGLEHGQHISFFTRKTLHFIAAEFKLETIYSFQSTHVLSRLKFSQQKLQYIFENKNRYLRYFIKPSPPSLKNKDLFDLTGVKRN